MLRAGKRYDATMIQSHSAAAGAKQRCWPTLILACCLTTQLRQAYLLPREPLAKESRRVERQEDSAGSTGWPHLREYTAPETALAIHQLCDLR